MTQPKTDRRWWRWWEKASLIIVFVGVFLGVLAVSLIVYNSIEIHNTVTGHNEEITATNNIVKQIQAKQNAHSQTLEKIAELTAQLAADKAIINVATMEGLADYQAICNRIPGCVLPYPVVPAP